MRLLDFETAGDTRITHTAGARRTAAPHATVARVMPFAAAMGITRLADVTGLDKTGIPVVMACRPNSRSVSVFQGKGVDIDAARASGLMEAVETYHAETVVSALRLTSADEMQRQGFRIAAHALPMSTGGLFHPRRDMLWIEGFDIARDEATWVPFDAVHCDYTTKRLSSGGCFQVSTNGLAAGNHPLEAINHGLYEVIERDATTLWNYLDDRAKRATEIDLGTVTDRWVTDMLERCWSAPLAVRAWEATSDIGIPVYIAELREESGSAGGLWVKPAFGSGCHAAKEVALLRAVTEAAQARTTFIAGARDDMSWEDYSEQESPVLARRRPDRDDPGYRDFHDVATHPSQDLLDDLHWVLGRLQSCGLNRVVVVDLSKPALQIPVVRVIVPGLEGPDEHYEAYVPGPRARALVQRTDRP